MEPEVEEEYVDDEEEEEVRLDYLFSLCLVC
jgi:hypothetical protein